MQRAVFIVMIVPLFISVQSNVKTTSTEVFTESSTESFVDNITDADNFTNEVVTNASPSVNDVDNETSCDVNNTNCTELATKEPPQDNNKTKLAQEIEEYSEKHICSCDLQLQICDINCCCDKDCSYENKLVFEKCDREENRFYDTRYCKYAMYTYKNNTLHEWEVTQNGLFCIVKSNLPASYSIHKELNLNSLEDANLQKSKKYSWSSLEINKTDIAFSPSSRFYYGQNVWISKNHSSIQPLQLPYNFVTSVCLSKRTVKFLENFKAKCTHTMINEENSLLNLENFVQNITIISRPWNGTDFKLCPKNICIPLEVKICEKHFDNCSVPINIHKLKFACQFSLYNNEKFCSNIVHMVKYNFYHNGTYGIGKAEALIVLEDIRFDLSQTPLYLQKFEVHYFWINHTLNYSSIRSGNPGYIIGKPILVANLLSTSNSTTANITNTLKRHHSDFTDNFMTFPANIKGLCVLSNNTNTPVEFGYSMMIKCKLKKKIGFEGNFTATSVCKQLQMSIFNYWSVKVGNETANFTKLVGKFGNANASNIKEWMPVAFSIDPSEILNSTIGKFTNENTWLSCDGIYSHLKVDLYHGREVVSELHNQQKILWATFRFEDRQDLLEFEVKETVVHLDVDLRMEIMFFDVTGEKIEKFVDAPALDIKLPYDFFYPFIKVSSNNCVASFANCYVALLCSVLISYFVEIIYVTT